MSDMRKFDTENWHRRDIYKTFRKFQFPHFAISAELNVTELVSFAKKHKLSFYRLMLYIVCRAGNERQAFRLRLAPDGVIEHESVGVAPAFGLGDGKYNFCTSDYNDNPAEFIRMYNEKENCSRKLDHLYLDDDHRTDMLYISCVPWLRTTAIINPLPNTEDAIPRITWGKYGGSARKLSMSLSLQMHHALADGYDAAWFYNRVQELADDPQTTFSALLPENNVTAA